ncbi:hypothetical protein EVAR_19338_1 [Eumeta japonica]|uniref:Uncharacterized protein n=1 Tax=Eumeta variegata TaxID=151549 RepID=A0A4C1TRD1_EUMVA|nr:hypothetical protein EVAR_19338_1 [Eumeta japonica]
MRSVSKSLKRQPKGSYQRATGGAPAKAIDPSRRNTHTQLSLHLLIRGNSLIAVYDVRWHLNFEFTIESHSENLWRTKYSTAESLPHNLTAKQVTSTGGAHTRTSTHTAAVRLSKANKIKRDDSATPPASGVDNKGFRTSGGRK